MDYKKKLKRTLYLGIIYVVCGIALMIASYTIETENFFLSIPGFGSGMLGVGILCIRNYFVFTKSEEKMKQQQIISTDERNLLIIQKANSAAFHISTILLGIIAIVLSFFDRNDLTFLTVCCLFLFLFIDTICYFIYQKKL